MSFTNSFQTTLIEQNASAQENIIKAFIDAYARFSDTRRYLQGIISKRRSTINSLITSYDSYEDLLSKATKGIEFYTKLETNVTKLLQRIRSSCKVQQEEREQMMSKIAPPPVVKLEPNPIIESNTPKLKDYLDSMKKKAVSKPVTGQVYPSSNYLGNMSNSNETQIWPPGIRPTPLGSEINEVATVVYESSGQLPANTYIQDKNSQFTNVNEKIDLSQQPKNQFVGSVGVSNQYIAGSYQAQPTENFSCGSDKDQMLEKRMNALTMSNKGNSSYAPYHQYNNPGYGYYDNISGNAALDKTDAPTQIGSEYGSYSQLNTEHYNYHQGYGVLGSDNKNLVKATGDVNQINLARVNASTGKISVANPNLIPSSYNPTTPLANINYLQHSGGNSTQTNLSNPNNLPQQANQTPTLSTETPQPYMHQYSPYIPTHYQQINPPTSESPNLQYEQSTPNNFYASGYAISQNFQSSGLATVQSNRYYSTDVTSQPDQTTGIFSATYGTAQTHQMQNSYYGYDAQQNYSQPADYASNIQNYNAGSLTYDVNNKNSDQESSTFNQSQYSEGYVGAGALHVPNQFNPSYMYTQAGMNYSYNTNNTLSSNGGLTSPQSVPNSNTGNYAHIQNYLQSNDNVAVPAESKNESTIDLLSGLDFSINQIPLEPELKKIEVVEKKQDIPVQKIQNIPASSMLPNSNADKKTLKDPETPKSTIKVTPSKPLENETVKKIFLNEIDKYEKFVDVLTNKTLSGSTNLDLKWKEIQDNQESDGIRKNISVARCYPMKNRFPDILPYDHSRVVLTSTEDDYINASYIKVKSMLFYDQVVNIFVHFRIFQHFFHLL